MKTQSSFSSFRNFASLTIQNVPSDDSDQTVKALADMNFHWGHMLEDTFSDWKLICFCIYRLWQLLTTSIFLQLCLLMAGCMKNLVKNALYKMKTSEWYFLTVFF